MNTKVKKIVKLATAGLFLIALAINVKVTLDDPFVMLSDDVIAQTTGTDWWASCGWCPPEDTGTDPFPPDGEAPVDHEVDCGYEIAFGFWWSDMQDAVSCEWTMASNLTCEANHPCPDEPV